MNQQVVSRSLRHHWPWLFHFHHHHPTSTKFSALYHHHLHLLPTKTPSSLLEPTHTRRFSLAASRGSLRRTNVQKDEEEQQQEDPSIKSRNELKREAKRAVKWGMDLSSFNPPQIKRILRFLFIHFLFLNYPLHKVYIFANFSFWVAGCFLWTKLSTKLLCWLRFLLFSLTSLL
jgi:hypothetical protein